MIVVLARVTVPGRFVVAICVAATGAAPAGAAAAPLVDDSAAEFAAATPTASTWVTEPGSVRLRPSGLSEGFDAAGLPASLTSVSWNPPAGNAAVGSGSLTVDGVRVHPPANTQTAPDVLEFRATFANTALQHAGFGDTLEVAPWAIFSTGGGGTGLSVRTQPPGAPAINEPIAADPLVPHVYRIEWAPTEVRYLVDDVVVATHAIAIAAPMRAVASDIAAGSGVITIDWLGTGAPASPGVFESRVHDAGDARAVWGGLTAVATGVGMETRSGNVSTPDGTWSGWQPIGAAGAIASPMGRYIQYRATLSGSSPALDRVEIDYEIDAAGNVGPVVGPPQSGGVQSSTANGTDPVQARDATAPKVRLLTRSARVSAAGLVAVRIRCLGDEDRCRLTVRMEHGRVRSARQTVSVAGGKAATVRLRLPTSTRSVLAARSRLKVTAVVTVRDLAGNARTVRRNVMLSTPAQPRALGVCPAC